jgi:uncharacterized membrane protein YuzA (DUF378 family)
MKVVDVVTIVLLIAGGFNWGIIGVFQYNPVEDLLGWGSALTRIVYFLVGLSALYQAMFWKAVQIRWVGSPKPDKEIHGRLD